MSNVTVEANLPIKALILAAGLGTRLRPLTDTKPKCLFELGNKPLLRIWIDKLREIGCHHIMVNTHYCAEQVYNYLDLVHLDGLDITISHEETLLGTAGTLLKNLPFFENSTTIMVHCDNAMIETLHRLVQGHYSRPMDCAMTMLTFHAQDPSCCGIVVKDPIGRILEFYEKAGQFHGNCANGAVYVLSPDFLQYLKGLDNQLTDFSRDVLSRSYDRIFTVHTDELFMDIGSPERLYKAQTMWNELSRKY